MECSGNLNTECSACIADDPNLAEDLLNNTCTCKEGYYFDENAIATPFCKGKSTNWLKIIRMSRIL